MAQILDSYNTSSAIYNIIHSAEKYVILICPFAPKDDSIFKDYIDKRKSDDVLLVFFLRSSWSGNYNDEYKNDDLSKIFKHYGTLKNVLIYRIPVTDTSFHAKCYFNESHFLISSMNLSYAERTNSSLECSALISKVNDLEEFSQCMKWFDLFCKYIGLHRYVKESILSNSLKFGYCIMCGVNIALMFDSIEDNFPFCFECKCRYLNDNIRRISRTYRYCIKCGNPVGSITISNPICWDCRDKGGRKKIYELRY